MLSEFVSDTFCSYQVIAIRVFCQFAWKSLSWPIFAGGKAVGATHSSALETRKNLVVFECFLTILWKSWIMTDDIRRQTKMHGCENDQQCTRLTFLALVLTYILWKVLLVK